MILVLSSDLIPRHLLHRLLGDIAQRDHTNRLPDTQTNPGRDTTVQSLDTVVLVNVRKSISHRHLLRTVGVVGLGLHFHADDFDGLIPGGETTAKGRGEDFLARAEFGGFVFAGEGADAILTERKEAGQ